MERMLIGSVQLNTTQSGKPVADLFTTDTRLEYPELRLFDLSELAQVGLDPNTIGSKRVHKRFWAHYTVSPKVNGKGNQYRDVHHLEPLEHTLTTNESTDTTELLPEILEELKAIRTYLKAICNHYHIPIDLPNGAHVEICPDCHCRPCICTEIDDAEVQTDTEPSTTHPEPETEPEASQPEPEYPQADDDEPLLRYGNGDTVGDNQAEIDAYLAFIKENRTAPINIQVLRVWCKQQEARRPNGNGRGVQNTAGN
jgi:hypothetical protein